MPSLRFTVTLETKNGNILPELQARISDLSPAFENIIPLWAKENEAKFSLGDGAEVSGVQHTGGVFWEPLTHGYIEHKRKKGLAEALMTATGQLRSALTRPEGFSQYLDASTAVFGQPLDDEDRAKVAGNWYKRQVIFLNQTDTLNIRREISNYLSMGADYQNILFARGLRAVARRSEEAAMDASFSETVG